MALVCVLAAGAAAPPRSILADPAAAAAQAEAFDIPAQPLGAALRALGTRTRLNLLYENDVVAGRRSAPVTGSMPREAALAAMLQGTGLLFRFVGPDDALVFPPDRLPDEAAVPSHTPGAAHMMLGLMPVHATPVLGSTASFMPYSQSVQAAIDRRLEADPAIHGRAFAAVLRVTIGPKGALHLASLVRSTGDAALDRSIAAAVNGAVAPDGPPAGMPQPIWFELVNQR